MRYRCHACDAVEWRGYFPRNPFHLRYAIFHGSAIGVCGIAAKALVALTGFATDGWGGLLVLAVGLPLMAVYYTAGLVAEGLVMSARRCGRCGTRGLQPD